MLRLFKIRYTSHYIQELLNENSDGDNLWGIISVLRRYGLNIEPHRIINVHECKDSNISTPFLTQYDNKILLIKEIEENIVAGCINGKKTTFSKRDFYSNWNGIIVSIRRGDVFGEPNFNNHRRKDLYILLSQIAIILSLIAIFTYRKVFFNIPGFISISFVLSCIGVIISYNIQLSLFTPNGSLNNMCALIKTSSCNQINGKSGYIAALGCSYFCSLCIFILLPLDNYILTVYIVSISAIEVVWSLAIQFIRQKFCINCIVVQAIVIIMIILCLPHITEMPIQDFIKQGLLFLFIFTIVFTTVSLKVWPNIAKRYKYRNKCRLMDYFKKQYLANSLSSEESTIKVFLNPYCGSCKKEYLESYNLIANRNLSKVIPIIVTSDSKGDRVAISLLDSGEASTLLYRLNEWYSWGYLHPEDFERKYKVSTKEKQDFADTLRANLSLAHEYNVKTTPAIICNGVKMPVGVSLADLLTL